MFPEQFKGKAENLSVARCAKEERRISLRFEATARSFNHPGFLARLVLYITSSMEIPFDNNHQASYRSTKGNWG